MSTSTWLWHPAQIDLPELRLQAGLQADQLPQLATLTQTDPLIAQTTHDLERFGTVAAIQAWLQSPRQILVLLDPVGTLLGIVWFSQKVLPAWSNQPAGFDPSHYQVTFGVRLYGIARGKGLATEFSRVAWQHFAVTRPVWLKTKKTNVPALKTYPKLGFRVVGGLAEEDEIVMVLDGPLTDKIS